MVISHSYVKLPEGINVDRIDFLKSDLITRSQRESQADSQGQWAVLENNASVTIISIKVFSPELHSPDPAMVNG